MTPKNLFKLKTIVGVLLFFAFVCFTILLFLAGQAVLKHVAVDTTLTYPFGLWAIWLFLTASHLWKRKVWAFWSAHLIFLFNIWLIVWTIISVKKVLVFQLFGVLVIATFSATLWATRKDYFKTK